MYFCRKRLLDSCGSQEFKSTAQSDLDLILTPVRLLSVFPQLYFHMIRQRKKVLGHAEDYSKVE